MYLLLHVISDHVTTYSCNSARQSGMSGSGHYTLGQCLFRSGLYFYYLTI